MQEPETPRRGQDRPGPDGVGKFRLDFCFRPTLDFRQRAEVGLAA